MSVSLALRIQLAKPAGLPVDEWRDPGDRVVEFGCIPLAGGELVPAGTLDRGPPDEKSG